MPRCGTCHHYGYCAPDCSLAPWNFEPASYPTSSFLFLLRQRRWVGHPVDRQDTRFCDERRERERVDRLYARATCAELDSFFDGELGEAEAAAFRDHLATCERCQRVLSGRMQESVAAAQSPAEEVRR